MTITGDIDTLRHDGVLRRSQLYEMGATEAEVRAQITAGRWRAVGTEVVVCHNGPLTRRQQLWAAVLSVAPMAALAGRTAAAEAGLAGWPGDCVEVVIARGASVNTGVMQIADATVYVHQSRRFSADDIHPSRTPPQTRAERSVVDAAAWTRKPAAACGLLAAAVQQRIVVPDRVLEELDKAGRVRHARLLRSALGDIGGGAQAFSEIHFGAICRRNGLPEPERQVVRVDENGRRRYLDVVLPGPDGRRVVVEIDGAVHLLPERYWDDMSRDNELVIDGERRLRFPTVALYIDEPRVVDQVRRALGLVSGRRRSGDACH